MTLYVLSRTHVRPEVTFTLGVYSTPELALARAERDMIEHDHRATEDWCEYTTYSGKYSVHGQELRFDNALLPAGVMTLPADRRMWKRETSGHAAGCVYAIQSYAVDHDYDWRGETI